jgi:endoglucanase
MRIHLDLSMGRTILWMAAVAVSLGVAPSPIGAASSSAVIRVNGVGYSTTEPARAYLMASAAETGATFTVKNASGTTVAGPTAIGASLGSWSTTYKYVYPLDFGPISTPGTYSIAVSGPVNAATTLKVDSPANLYAAPLANALSFYQTERDGPGYIPNALRTAAGHLNDAHATTYVTPSYNAGSGRFSGDLTPTGEPAMDASGGWWDAGDYLKFTGNEAYTDIMMLIGIRDFPSQFGATVSGSTWSAEARFGAGYLSRMWNDSTRTLYYQVGIGAGNAQTTSDHDIWRLPQADDTYGGCTNQYRYICNRPVFREAPGGSLLSPNLAGRMAAALALCYQDFRTTDSAFAGQCLLSAEHIFDLANTSWTGNLVTAIPYSFYPETEWRDDMELGATELYDALADGLPSGVTLPHTDPTFYLQKAATWADAYITGPNDAADTLNLYDVSGLAHFELYNAIGAAGNPSGLAVTQAQLLSDLKKQLDKAVSQAGTDPFGFGFPWATWDTTSHGAGLVVMASEYDQLTGSTAYAQYTDRWLANVLGANAWGLSFIVGDGTNFPHCLQHQVANLAGHLDGTQPVLNGAAVEGPNSTATKGAVSGMIACPANGVDTYAQFNGSKAEFQDNMQSYSNTEPAIDLTATSPLAFARYSAGLR